MNKLSRILVIGPLLAASAFAQETFEINELTEATTAAATDIVNIQKWNGSDWEDFRMTLLNLLVNADAQVAAIANSTPAADKLWVWSSSTAGNYFDVTSFGRSLIDDADAITARGTLGLTIGTHVQAWDAELDVWATKTAPSGTVVGTSDTQTLTSKTLATDQNVLPAEIGVAASDETTAITVGTGKVTFRMPFAMTVTAVRASLTTASSSGAPTIDINENGTTILSTKLTIDANEKTSTTAAAAAVISDASLADDAEITIDIDVAGTGATGVKVWLIGTK